MLCPVQAIGTIDEKTPVYSEEPENSQNKMKKNQSGTQDFYHPKISIPNGMDEIKRTVFDSFFKPNRNNQFNRKEPSGCKGGRGCGRQNRRRKKW
jgi:hypothetical protein